LASEERIPSEEELRQALEQVGVADVLLGTLTSVVSLGFHRVAEESRDLPQAKLAIEALRALTPILAGSVPDEVVHDFEQATANLQLAYAKAVGEELGASPDDGGGGEPESEE
jgi:hypothetical protein